ncbi:MAG: CPBP family intramembrane metalloprotease [Lachnospiraceae bacterium]|nr:CPBP family intramembrane metalloprotease [Lachnospiraceae bacterium]
MSENKGVNRIFLLTVVLYVGMSFALSFLSVFVPAFQNMSNYTAILISQMLVFVPGFLYLRTVSRRVPAVVQQEEGRQEEGKTGILRLLPYRKISIGTIALVVVCTYLMYPLIIVLNAISMIFSTSGSAAVLDMMQGQNFFLSLLFTAVMPACVEEFLFRGLMFQTYKKSRMLPAILLTGFLFGCMHMNLNQFIYAFALGIYLAFLVEATGSIFSSMIAHFTLNATSVVMSFLLPILYHAAGIDPDMQIQAGGYASTMESSELLMFLMGITIWAIIAVGTTCGAVGIYIAICKINHRWDYVKRMFSGGTRERIITIPLIAAALICFAVMGMRIYIERMG